MLCHIVDIQERVFEIVAVLQDQLDSLQRELEFLLSNNAQFKTMAAKKRQIETMKSLHGLHKSIFSSLDKIASDQFKLEACAVYYGVSLGELKLFMGRDLKQVERDIAEHLSEGFVTVPECLRPLIDEEKSKQGWVEKLAHDLDRLKEGSLSVHAEASEPVRYATVPAIPFDVLRSMAGQGR